MQELPRRRRNGGERAVMPYAGHSPVFITTDAAPLSLPVEGKRLTTAGRIRQWQGGLTLQWNGLNGRCLFFY